MIIYISGPYTNGDPLQNTLKAIDVGNKIAEAGHTVIIPHLSHFWHEQHPHEWDFWMKQDLELLRVCDALVRIPGESKGADMEWEAFGHLWLPRYTYQDGKLIPDRERSINPKMRLVLPNALGDDE